MKKEIENAMKELHYIQDVTSLSYKDLCIHQNLGLPEWFKVPKFKIFGRTGNSLAYWRGFCDQLDGVVTYETLMMRLFRRRLREEALEWSTS